MEQYYIIRSKRKTIAIHIVDGEVIVKAPLRMPKSNIDEFVNSKQDWIKKSLAVSLDKKEQRENFALKVGDSILLLGKSCSVVERVGSRAGFDGEFFYVPLGVSQERIKRLCINIYKKIAKKYITERVVVFSNKMALNPKCIKITSAAMRWGSCSIKGTINFSWRLMMADEDVVDYLVVHELAHLIVMNHSKKFWEIVQKVLPDYKERQAKLKVLSKKLSIENWD